jgi:hypothetical protein
MFAQGRQSHVSSVDAVTLRHAQPKLKHLAMHWANKVFIRAELDELNWSAGSQ